MKITSTLFITVVLQAASCEAGVCDLDVSASGIQWASPGFREGVKYPSGFDCQLNSASERPYQAVYTFNSFQLQKKKKKKCRDFVKLRLPFSRSVSFCGGRQGKYITPNFKLKNTFKTDKKKNYNGFNITVTPISTSCHQLIDMSLTNETEGEIMSPRYPKKFPKNSQCEWWIKAPEGKQVQLTINDLTLKSDKKCKKAYIVVDKSGTADYSADNSVLHCSGGNLPVVTSTAGTLNVIFNGGPKRTRGLKATYTI